jgi:hypothetical protein
MKGIDKVSSMILLKENPGLHCPYSGISDVCNASLSLLSPSAEVRTAFCNSDDYDDCPLFLAKVLRRR